MSRRAIEGVHQNLLQTSEHLLAAPDRVLDLAQLAGSDELLERAGLAALDATPLSAFCRVGFVADLDGDGARQHADATWWHAHCVPMGERIALDADPQSVRDEARFRQESAPAGSRCPRCGKPIG